MICCKECLGLLTDYLEGELDDQTVAALEAHFEDCPPCVAFLKTYKTTTNICRDTLKTVEIPMEVQKKLIEFVKSQIKTK